MSLYNDPQWIKDSQIYQNDILKFSVDAFRFQPTWQQTLLFENSEVMGSRISVKYGWGCNDSMIEAYAVIALHNLLFRKDSATIIMTPSDNNSHAVIYSVIEQFIKRLGLNKLSYLSKYITKNQKMFSIKKYEYFTYIKIIKDTSSVGPISIAGILNHNYLFIAFDAERIEDEWLSVGLSNMAQPENRCIFSQKMDTDILKTGQFYQFTKHENWKHFTFSSAEDPNHVWSEQDQFAMKIGLKPCVIDGEYYKASSFYTYSVNLENALATLKNQSQFDTKEYVLSIQAIDQQRSVIGLFRLSSKGQIELIDIPYFKEFDLNRMFEIIKVLIEKYQKIRVILNCSGTGIILKKLLEKCEIHFENMSLGSPCFSQNDRNKYKNRSAKAFKKFQDCILDSKFSIKSEKKHKRIIKELINIPHYINCSGKYAIPTLEERIKLEMQDLNLALTIAACFIE
nr:hypothetical protein [uncultured Acinetobacter sp.]